VARWVRKRGDVFGVWHLRGEPPLWAVDRGLFVAACGLPLGDRSARLERVDEDTMFGTRCPACDLVDKATTGKARIESL
jgi:hypothetical protein